MQKWYVDASHAKVTVVAGVQAANVLLVSPMPGAGRPWVTLWRPAGSTVTPAEAAAANAEQESGPVPALAPLQPALPAPGPDATQGDVAAAIAALVNSAPSALDTLGELAAALQGDESAASALTALVAQKAPLASPAFTGTPTKGGSPVLSQADASGAYAAKWQPDQAGAQVVLILDDVKISHYTIAAPAVEAIGGKLTLAVNSDAIGLSGSQMTGAQLAELYGRGHEVACHSKTHTLMPSLTATTRIPEWDTSKAAIEALIGAGNCKTWVYPGNNHSTATDAEGYLRYDRLFVGPTQGAPLYRPLSDRGGLVHGRWGWADVNHAQTLALINNLAAQSVVIPLYTHSVDGSLPGSGVTQAQFQELINLCASLNIPLVTARQGFPSHVPIVDPGFEDSTLAAWTLTLAGASTITSVADAPQTGYPGSRSLQIVGDGSGSNIAQSILVPMHFPSEVHTLSLQMHAVNVTVGNFFAQIQEYDGQGNTLATTNAPAIGVGTTAWTQKTLDWTPNALTRTYAVRCVGSSTFTGTAYFDHLHVGPKRRGVFG